MRLARRFAPRNDNTVLTEDLQGYIIAALKKNNNITMILAFDSGTTNTKALLFNNGKELVAWTSHPTRIIHKGPGIVEQKAEYWWNAIVKASEKLRDTPEWKKNDIEAIAISSQGGTFVPLSGDSRPLCNGITWLDNRGHAAALSLNRQYGEDYFYRKTGHRLKGWSPPAICKNIARQTAIDRSELSRISFVADYLNFKLTGNFFLDATSAQMSCFYNIEQGSWDEGILAISGMENIELPDVIPSDSAGGKLTKEAAGVLGLREGIPVAAGGHDQYCASAGAGALNSGDCLLSCGTAWVMLLVTDNIVFPHGVKWVPGRHLRPGCFGLMSAMSNGGVVLDWIRANIRIRGTGSTTTDRLNIVPEFSGRRGAIKNISLSTTGRDIYMAAMKSLSTELKKRLERVKGHTGIKRFMMVGGGVREEGLPSIIEEITGMEVFLPPVKEAAGRGAAILGGNL